MLTHLRERLYLTLNGLYNIRVFFPTIDTPKNTPRVCDTKFYMIGSEVVLRDCSRTYSRTVRANCSAGRFFPRLVSEGGFRFYFLRGCHMATGRRKAANICLQWAKALPVEVDPTMMCPTEYAFIFAPPWSLFNSATVNLSCIVWKECVFCYNDFYAKFRWKSEREIQMQHFKWASIMFSNEIKRIYAIIKRLQANAIQSVWKFSSIAHLTLIDFKQSVR